MDLRCIFGDGTGIMPGGRLRRFMGDVLLIYLDYTANAPVEPAVLERFVRVERGAIGNPNSLHQAGRAAGARCRPSASA